MSVGTGRAIARFEATDEDELSLEVGDELEIIGFNGSFMTKSSAAVSNSDSSSSSGTGGVDSGGWWLAKKNGSIGSVPVNCVSTEVNTKRKAAYAASYNKEPIFGVLHAKLQEYLETRPKQTSSSSESESSIQKADDLIILEVAAGTGEHANYIGSNSDFTTPTDLYYVPVEPDLSMHESIECWTQDVKKSNVKYSAPLGIAMSLDLELPICPLTTIEEKPITTVDVVICNNMTHISHISSTEGLFRFCNRIVKAGGLVYFYGPYRVNGFMVPSNERFDVSLKQRNPDWGVRDLEQIQELGLKFGFVLQETVQMPVNNLSVIFKNIGI